MKTHALPVVAIIALALLPALTIIFSLPFNTFGFGLLSGWLGTGLISASLLLMVREPIWAAWFGGLQRMYQWHHGMGMMGYVFLLAHPLLLAAHYLVLDPDIAWQYLSPFNPPSPNILGWASLFAFMLGLAATFALSLPYRLWRRLHVLLAIAILLGLGHIWIVNGLSISLTASLLPAVIAIGWRLLRANRGVGSRPYEVSAVHHPAGQITEIALRPLATPMHVAPAQFVVAAFFEGPKFQGCGEFHPYTVSHAAEDGGLVLSIKALGDCTRHIQSLEPGVAVRLQGPYGTFLLDRPFAPEIWIAAGMGITPFLALLRDHPVTQHVDLVYIHRDSENTPYEKELQTYGIKQELLQFHSLTMTSDPALLFAWLENITGLSQRQVYLCGPQPLIALVTNWLQEHGVSRLQIHFEQFDLRK